MVKVLNSYFITLLIYWKRTLSVTVYENIREISLEFYLYFSLQFIINNNINIDLETFSLKDYFSFFVLRTVAPIVHVAI